MKKLLFIFLSLLILKTSSSQVLIALLFGDKLNSGKLEFGLMISPALTNLTNIESKLRPGVDLGLYFNLKMSDRLYLHPEAIPKLVFGAKDITPYSTGNTSLDSLYANGTITRTIKAIGLPLLVRYRIAGLLFAEGGAQIDMLTTSKDLFKTKVDDNMLSYDKKTKGSYTRFDAGYVLGLAYKIKPGIRGMTIDLRYYGGLTDIMKTMESKQANSAWLLNIYIPIGAGKAIEKTSTNGN